MNNNLSVKNKIFFLFVFVIVTSISIIGWFGFKSAKDSYIEYALLSNESESHALSSKIKGMLETIPTDLNYNANFYALERLLIWEDLQDKNKIKEWENVYISVLKDYILNKKLYYQVRILDVNGNEKILLKYNKSTDKVTQIPGNRLKNQADKDYFKEAIKLKKGEFYISEMNLNLEHGIIEKPYMPVIRYSTPLIDKNEETKGVLVLNFDANSILNEIAAAKTLNDRKDHKRYYLINENGDYLYDTDNTKRWGFQLGKEYSFKEDFPGIMEEFKSEDEINIIKNGKIFSMHKIYPDKSENRYRYWYLVTELDESVALSTLDTFITVFFIILSLTLATGLLLINWYISKLMNPLSEVTSKLKALSNGEIKKTEIPYYAEDEIGQIVKSTAILVDAIETTINQANSVANGNFTKDIQLLSKNDKLGLALISMTKRLKEITKLASNLSKGNYDVNIIVKESDDELGLALTDMIKYLEKIAEVTESIAAGEINVDYSIKGKDDRLGHAIAHMIEYLKSILKQAELIMKGDFSQSLIAKSHNDELGLALVLMTDILRQNSIKNKNEIFFSEGVGEFSDKLTGISEPAELAETAITLSCRYIKASSGVLYTFDKEKEELNLAASFAYTPNDNLSKSFQLGNGVVGQVALEKKAILLKDVKDDEFKVHSATTHSKSKEVYVFPFIYEDELFGVAEIMSFKSFTQNDQKYLQKISEIFATALFTTIQNSKIKMLLEKSQQAYEELQVQSEELQESNVQMEEQQQQLTLQSQELSEKNENLLKANDEIEKASAYKSEFLANMSHELRTPLNSIILLSKLLTQNQNNTLTESDVEKASVIHKAGNELLLLINDILDLSKIESGNMELSYSNVNSAEIASEMKGLFDSLADEKKLDFIVDDKFNSSFYTDKTKLSQVLKNLLSNAFKFTKKGSITLEFKSEDNTLIITVKDTGIGIPDDKVASIFDAFKQVDGSISREYGGTGLGLSITKTIIDLMGGSISVESKYEKGSSFIVTLALRKSEEELPLPKIEKDSDTTESDTLKKPIILEEDEEDIVLNQNEFEGKNILIVDDDSRNIFALTSTIENMGGEVYSAFNGKEAIEVLENGTKIDLILMDIMMPIMDGLKAIESIKSDEKYKDIPVVAVTAKVMPEDKQKCMDAGANDYLPKPINHNALISTMRAWIK